MISQRKKPFVSRHRGVLLGLWLLAVGAAVYGFLFHREAVQRELQTAMSVSMFAAAFLYLLIGGLRGFTLLPATSLLLVGVVFFPPVPLFFLTLAGILVSSACVYWFSEALRLEEIFSHRHGSVLARLKTLLRHRELPIIIGWSFFPFAPTDLIVYVCGVLRVDLKKCLLGVLIGEGAICGIYIFLGDRLLRWMELKI